MNVIESEYNGFCKGVTDALSLVDKAVKTGTPVFLTEEIIHKAGNKQVCKNVHRYRNMQLRKILL